jgi:hypothetical protein
MPKRKNKKEKIKCLNCGVDFKQKKKKQKYCSPECAVEFSRKKTEGEPLYILEDQSFPDGKFEIRKTEKAWWKNRDKVQKLIDAFKMDSSVIEARAWAGISLGQWDYFNEIHPAFSEIKEQLSQLPCLSARTTVVASLKSNPMMALEYLRHKKRDEFSTRAELTGPGGTPLGSPAVNNYTLILQNANPEDRKQYIDSVRRILKAGRVGGGVLNEPAGPNRERNIQIRPQGDQAQLPTGNPA